MAWTNADLETIEAAIASGAKRVRFQTHEAEYHSMTEMLRARDVIKAAINPASAPSSVVVAKFYRGLSCR
jgi:hypothetical protein